MKPLLSLQAGRAIAAIGVVFHHANERTGTFVSHVPEPLASIMSMGYLGVDFFFVLSGFIILSSHYGDSESLGAMQRYVRKRLARIYTPYLPISVLMIAAYLAFPTFSAGNRDWGLLTSLTLLPSEHPPALSVAWTLVHEMVFYSLFLTFFVSKRAFVACVILWIFAIGHGVTGGAVARVVFAPINLEFIAGMVCAVMARRLPQKYGLPMLYIGSAAAAVAAFGVHTYDAPREAFGLCIALAVLGAALSEDRLRHVIPASVVLLGNASYAVYLAHNPTISVAARLCAKMGAGWALTLLFLVGASIAAGCIYHLLFEKPALAVWRHRLSARSI